MRFRPLLLSVLAAASLAACSPETPVAVRYDVSFQGVSTDRLESMPPAITNVIGGRLARLGVTPADLKVSLTGSGAVATATMPSPAADQVTAELTAPYTLRFMRQSGTGETVTISVAQYGDFSESGLTETHVDWIEAGTDAQGLGSVMISFNDAGHTLLGELAKTDADRQYGLFAKGKLISLFTMESTFGGDIVLNKIPSAELAAVFADDVNVGLHATFVRAQ